MDAQEKQINNATSSASYGQPVQDTSNTQHSSGYKDNNTDEMQYTTPLQKIAAVNNGDVGMTSNDIRGEQKIPKEGLIMENNNTDPRRVSQNQDNDTVPTKYLPAPSSNTHDAYSTPMDTANGGTALNVVTEVKATANNNNGNSGNHQASSSEEPTPLDDIVMNEDGNDLFDQLNFEVAEMLSGIDNEEEEKCEMMEGEEDIDAKEDTSLDQPWLVTESKKTHSAKDDIDMEGDKKGVTSTIDLDSVKHDVSSEVNPIQKLSGSASNIDRELTEFEREDAISPTCYERKKKQKDEDAELSKVSTPSCGLEGVYHIEGSSQYKSLLKSNGFLPAGEEYHFLGKYDLAVDAAMAHDKAALTIGPHWTLNFSNWQGYQHYRKVENEGTGLLVSQISALEAMSTQMNRLRLKVKDGQCRQSDLSQWSATVRKCSSFEETVKAYENAQGEKKDIGTVQLQKVKLQKVVENIVKVSQEKESERLKALPKSGVSTYTANLTEDIIKEEQLRCDWTSQDDIERKFKYCVGKGQLAPLLSTISDLITPEKKVEYMRKWRSLTYTQQEQQQLEEKNALKRKEMARARCLDVNLSYKNLDQASEKSFKKAKIAKKVESNEKSLVTSSSTASTVPANVLLKASDEASLKPASKIDSMLSSFVDQTSPPPNTTDTGFKEGRWTDEEHVLFLQALKLHGTMWKKVAAYIKTRTVVQTRTHAQKYFQKMKKNQANNNSIIARLNNPSSKANTNSIIARLNNPSSSATGDTNSPSSDTTQSKLTLLNTKSDPTCHSRDRVSKDEKKMPAYMFKSSEEKKPDGEKKFGGAKKSSGDKEDTKMPELPEYMFKNQPKPASRSIVYTKKRKPKKKEPRSSKFLPPLPKRDPRGVTIRPSGKWQVQIYYANKSRYIGLWDTKEEAARGYELARRCAESFGDDYVSLSQEQLKENVKMMQEAAFATSDESSDEEIPSDEDKNDVAENLIASALKSWDGGPTNSSMDKDSAGNKDKSANVASQEAPPPTTEGSKYIQPKKGIDVVLSLTDDLYRETMYRFFNLLGTKKDKKTSSDSVEKGRQIVKAFKKHMKFSGGRFIKCDLGHSKTNERFYYVDDEEAAMKIYGDMSRRMGSASKWLSPNADNKASGNMSDNTNDDDSDTEKVVTSAMKSYAPPPASYKGVSTVPLPYKGPGHTASNSPSKGRGRPSEGRTHTRHDTACRRCGRTFASRKGLEYHRSNNVCKKGSYAHNKQIDTSSDESESEESEVDAGQTRSGRSVKKPRKVDYGYRGEESNKKPRIGEYIVTQRSRRMIDDLFSFEPFTS